MSNKGNQQDGFDFAGDDSLVCGVDEVGRGPLAGPVVAAAVILDPDQPIEGLTDSKKISEKKRERLFDEIKQKAKAWAISRADVEEIDEINILHASMLAMERAVNALPIRPTYALIDGNRCPQNLPCPSEPIIKGDLKEPAISAASILAKVSRDRELVELEETYPGYGLAQHKGYPTKSHIVALQQLGVTPIHRRSFGPVRDCLEEEG